MDELKTHAENTWCPGCGNFGIMAAFGKALKRLDESGIRKENIIITAGIGCHGKIFDYLNMSGFYSLHGRAVATGQGIKIANPGLKVVVFVGDGDSYGEGLEHLIFAAKRNADITVIVHNNGAYALTTGQTSPTSVKGHKGPSTPKGSIEDPLNPLALMLEAGATFIARGYSGKIDHLAGLMAKGIEHKGFSIIDVLQPSVVFNDTYALYNEKTALMNDVPDNWVAAMRAIKEDTGKIPLGIFFRTGKKPHHAELLGERNPVTDRLPVEERLRMIKKFITSNGGMNNE